jgi:hypothetical protein
MRERAKWDAWKAVEGKQLSFSFYFLIVLLCYEKPT